MRPPICLALKTQTLSAAPSAAGKACRPVIGVSLIALQAFIEASRANCCKERPGIVTTSPRSTTPQTWPRDFLALRSRQSMELGFADALVQPLRLSSEAEHSNRDLKCRTLSCAREENGSLEDPRRLGVFRAASCVCISTPCRTVRPLREPDQSRQTRFRFP
jgi:hypothetical protein